MAENIARIDARLGENLAQSGAALGFSPNLLSEILENVAAGIAVWDAELRLVTWNSIYRRLNGVSDQVLRVGARLAEILDNCAPLLNDDRTGEELEALTRKLLRDNGRLDLDRPLADGRIISVAFYGFSEGGWIAIYHDVTERRQAIQRRKESERALKLQKARLDASLDRMPHGFSIWDEKRRLALWNRRYAEIYRFPPARLRSGMTLAELCELGAAAADTGETAKDLFEIYHRRFEETAELSSARSYERIINGRVINATHSRVAGIGWVITHEDITDYREQLKLAEARGAELEQQSMRLEAAVSNMPLSLSMFDSDHRLVICNQNYARIFGLPPDLIRPGTPLADIIRHRQANGSYPADEQVDYFKRRLDVIRSGTKDVSTIELQDGRVILVRHQPLPDGGWIATQEDITDQQRAKARISHLARHDPLTGLPNRSHFREQMEMAEARIRCGETMAVLCVDLDHFKGVNDTLGHSVGDAVLEEVAHRLKSATSEVDVVGRLGGDEFAVLQGELASPEDAAVLAKRIVEAIAEPFDVHGHHILIGTSIGIAVAPADGTDTDTLMKNADLALYRAKGEGRGACRYFEPGMDAAIRKRRSIEVGLRLALARKELRLVYQPLLSLEANRITGFEALLRWDHPERGTMTPDEFVPIAEDTGLIIPIGEWVLREACAVAATWPEHVAVAVNLSPVQFKSRNLPRQVAHAISEAGIAPNRLEIEVTEALLLSNRDLTLKILHQLRALGVRISMDDFGTGYSSLNHLRAFPFDKLKIDRSFVSALASEGDSSAIVTAVIGVGRSLGIATAAEGVETEEQLELVRQQGCTEVQGFLFSPPLPAAAVAGLFASAASADLLEPLERNAS